MNLVIQNLSALLHEEIDINRLKKRSYLLAFKNDTFSKGIKFIKE
jgi:hypothetical protein